MNTSSKHRLIGVTITALASASTAANAQLISNGGFESGLTGWTRVDQLGSDGGFMLQSGSASPLNGFSVPLPSGGTRAAMTDSGSGGSHVLYQDFTVPASVPSATVRFSLYLNNGAESYFTPASLDWAMTNQNGTLNLNQQARVDIIGTSADLFSVGASDVLANLFATTTASPAINGYTVYEVDITALLQAHLGETLRLRFAEVDNVNFFNFGVDDVSVTVVPAPSVELMTIGTLLGLMRRRASR